MAVIEYDSYKQKLLAMDETFENLFKALEIEQARQELNRLELEAHEDGFWNDLERSQKNQMRSKQLQNKIHRYEKLVSTRDDLLALIDMGTEMTRACCQSSKRATVNSKPMWSRRASRRSFPANTTTATRF